MRKPRRLPVGLARNCQARRNGIVRHMANPMEASAHTRGASSHPRQYTVISTMSHGNLVPWMHIRLVRVHSVFSTYSEMDGNGLRRSSHRFVDFSHFPFIKATQRTFSTASTSL